MRNRLPQTRTIGLDGAFLRAPVGSSWWFLAEELTLTGIAVWSRPRTPRMRSRVALAQFSGAERGRPVLFAWTGVEPRRWSPLRPVRFLDTLRPAQASWGWAAREAIAAEASADPDTDEPLAIVDPSGVRWECDVRALPRLDRSDGALAVDAAAVAAVVELHPESADDDALDPLWLLADADGRTLASYSVHPNVRDPEPGVDEDRLEIQQWVWHGATLVLGLIAAVVATRIL